MVGIERQGVVDRGPGRQRTEQARQVVLDAIAQRVPWYWPLAVPTLSAAMSVVVGSSRRQWPIHGPAATEDGLAPAARLAIWAPVSAADHSATSSMVPRRNWRAGPG